MPNQSNLFFAIERKKLRSQFIKTPVDSLLPFVPLREVQEQLGHTGAKALPSIVNEDPMVKVD